jgi:mannosyltransferase
MVGAVRSVHRWNGMNDVQELFTEQRPDVAEAIDQRAGGPVVEPKSSALPDRLIWVILSLVVAVGVILRWRLLTARNLWDDEAASVFFAQLSRSSFLTTLRNYEANMGLYYFLLRGWLYLGDSAGAVRSLSVVFGVAAIPSIYVLGKRLFGETVGLVSAGLAAVNIFQIRYSQEARGYSLVMLLSILSTYSLLRAMEAPREKKYWRIYVVLSALGVYAHVYFFLVVTAQWISLGDRWLWPRSRTLVRVAAGFLFLTSPMIWFLAAKNQGQINWITRPTPLTLIEFAKFFTGDGGSAALAVYGVLCLIALFAAYRKAEYRLPDPDQRWRANVVASWLVFPIASTVLVSTVHPVFYDRFMIISAPALVLLAGKGMVDLKQIFPNLRHLFSSSLILIVGLSIWGIHRYDTSLAAKGDSWQTVTQYILARQQPGDAAFFYRASGSRPFTYYSHRAMEKNTANSSPLVIFPADLTNALQFNVNPDSEQVSVGVEKHRRVWLVLEHWKGVPVREDTVRIIQKTLQEKYQFAGEKSFPGTVSPILVLLYTACESP